MVEINTSSTVSFVDFSVNKIIRCPPVQREAVTQQFVLINQILWNAMPEYSNERTETLNCKL